MRSTWSKGEQLARVAAYHDKWAEHYDTDIATMSLYNRVTLDNIKRFVPSEPEARILDAGGGTGFWSVELAKMGYHIMLTDISDGMRAKAGEKVSSLGLEDLIEVRNANILDMPEFAGGSFAMVLCEGDPLSYCGDHERAMSEMTRVLMPGGTMIVSVDNRCQALHWLKDADADVVERFLQSGDVLIPPDRPENERYLCHAFTPTELRELFERHGLTVERMIGKTVLRREELYVLELRYCDHPDFIQLGGHLEIAGRKE